MSVVRMANVSRLTAKALAGFILTGACALGARNAAAQGTLQTFVSIVPQTYFVQKIGGERVRVAPMVRPGASPASYEPKPGQMVALTQASVYFAVGVPFEKTWLGRIQASNPNMLVVHTESGIAKIAMKGHVHQEAEAGSRQREKGSPENHEGILDPHVWLAPHLVIIQARNILRAFTQVDPAHRSSYEANYLRFCGEIAALDAELMTLFGDLKDAGAFMVFHPAWGYLAEAYGLHQIPVEIEGKEPRPAELERLVRYARDRGVKVVFVQPQFSTKSAEVVASAIGGRIAIADPLAADWAENLRRVAMAIKSELR